MKPEVNYWPRAIILVDMNAFFAAIEQQDYPELKGRPIAITNGEEGSCIITASYEARAFGIKTGMRLREGKRLCPQLLQIASRPKRYTEISRNIMQALADITPDMEVFSVDEAFLDVTYCQRLYGSPEYIAQLVKQTVFDVSGLHCSIGVSGDKTTAKFAAKRFKPNGFCVIAPWEAKHVLAKVPVTELCGIASGIAAFLSQYGVQVCGDMEKVPISILAKRFGNLGRRLWHMCQGSDPDLVHTNIAAPKSMGHSKIIPPGTKQQDIILFYLRYLSEKLAARLRRHEMQAQIFSICTKGVNKDKYGGKHRLTLPTDDGKIIYDLGKQLIFAEWQGQGLIQVKVNALDPKPTNMQLDLLIEHDENSTLKNQTIDDINNRYGSLTVMPATLLQNNQSVTSVISPAWKPKGHRQTIE